MSGRQRGLSGAEPAWVVLRSPLLSQEETDQLRDALAEPSSTISDLPVTHPAWGPFREALYLSAPDLERRLRRALLDDDDGEWGRLRPALRRYVARMGTRPVPFGLSAGVTVASVGRETDVALLPRSRSTRSSRLTAHYAHVLADCAAELGGDDLLVVRNDTLYRVAGRWRYVERRATASGRPRFDLSEVGAGRALDMVLDAAGEPRTIRSLLDLLAGRGVPIDQARSYLTTLREDQLLVSALGPLPVSGDEAEPTMELGARCSPSFRHLGDTVASVTATLDRRGLGQPSSAYRDLEARLVHFGLPRHARVPLRVDLFKPAERATVSARTVDRVLAAADALRLLSGRAEDPLAAFATRLALRYEEQEVPLLEALDPDVGVGWSDAPLDSRRGELLRELAPRNGRAQPSPQPADEIRLRLLDRAARGVSRGSVPAAVLTSGDLDGLDPAETPPLPESFAVRFALLEDVPGGPRQAAVLYGVSGPPGSRLVARFGGLSAPLDAGLRREAERERQANEGVLVADILHVPSPTLADVCVRSVQRDAVITVLGRPPSNAIETIPVSDLRVSVVAGHIVLRSASRNVEVVPRLSNAHNFVLADNLPAYQLLALVAAEGGSADFTWSWGGLEGAPSLPRVWFGDVVLAPASWCLRRRDVAPSRAQQPRGPLLDPVTEWLREHRVARFVTIRGKGEGILLDTEDVEDREELTRRLGHTPNITLTEALEHRTSPVRGHEGVYAHDVIAGFCMPGGQPAVDRARARPWPVAGAPARVRRHFPPGSRWTYLKLYCGPGTADQVLSTAVLDTVGHLTEAGLVERWFFIRYNDPDWHVRLRLLSRAGVEGLVLTEALDRLRSTLPEHVARRLETATYVREVERYGGAFGVAFAERVFAADSSAVLDLLPRLAVLDEPARVAQAAVGMLWLLRDIGVGARDRSALIEARYAAMKAEVGPSRAAERLMSAMFKNLRPMLGDLESARPAEDVGLALAPLEVRSGVLAGPARRAARYDRRSGGALAGSGLASGICHMHVNRLFAQDQRRMEFAAWDLLRRWQRVRS